MVQLIVIHPTLLTFSNLQENLFIISTEVCFIQMWISPSHTHRFIVSSPIGSRLTSTPPCPKPALVSNIYNVFISNPSPQFLFSFNHVPLYYHLRHNSPHARATFLFHAPHPLPQDPASPLYLIYTTQKDFFQQIYPAHYLPENSELAVLPWVRAECNKV